MRIRCIATLMMMFPLLADAQTFVTVTERRTDANVSAATSGTPSGGGQAPANSNNNRDFFSTLIAALQSFSEGGGEALTFERNFSARLLRADARGKVQATLRQPDLSAPLVEKLGTDTKRITALRGALSYDDDVAVSVSISPDVAAPTNALAAAFATLRSYERATGAGAMNVAALASGLGGATTFSALPLDMRERGAEHLVETLIEPFAERAAVTAANESKWVFEMGGRIRHENVGPNEYFAKAAWEIGPGAKSVRAVRNSDCGTMLFRTGRVARDATIAPMSNDESSIFARDNCAARLLQAIVDDTNDPLTFRQARVALSLDARWARGADVRLSGEPLVELAGKSSRSVAASVSGGFDLFKGPPNTTEPLENSGRLDFALTYDDVSGDPARNNKFIAAVTYSQRVGETLQFPVTLMYASDSDYLTNVDRKLNAHFGISYKVPQKK